jgi:uncharacterized protein Yka (UPF0111/DUF47 family)
VALRLLSRDDRGILLIGGLADLAASGATELAELLSAQPDDRRQVVERLLALEQEAHTIRRDLLLHGRNSLMSPIEPTRLHAIGLSLTHAVERMAHSADLATGIGVKEFPEDAVTLVRVLGRMAELTVGLVPRLRQAAGPAFDHGVQTARLGVQARRAHAAALGTAFTSGRKTVDMVRVQLFVDGLAGVAEAFADAAEALEALALTGR